MAATRDTIDHNTLTHLAEAGAVRRADVIGQPGGWGVIIKYGATERMLAARRGAVRIFKKFDTLVGYLKDMGIAEYRVDAANYAPSSGLTAPRSRPDAAERLKRAHEAAAYDKWFRVQVQAALDDPRPSVSHEQAMADAKAKIAKIARRKKGARREA